MPIKEWTQGERKLADKYMHEGGPLGALAEIFANASTFAETQTSLHPEHRKQFEMIASRAMAEMKHIEKSR